MRGTSRPLRLGSVRLLARSPLLTSAEGSDIFRLLRQYVPAVQLRWGFDEPLRSVWGAGSAEQAWSTTDDVLFDSGRGGPLNGYIGKAWAPRLSHGAVILSVASELLDQRVVGLVQEWARLFTADYAHVHVITRREANAYIPHGVTWTDHSGPWLIVTPFELRRFLPDLYWGTVLGPAYVALLGAGHIAATPAFEVQELASDMFWVQLTADVHDVENDYDTFQQARERAKAHLGEDLFYSRERDLTGPYRTISAPVPEPTRESFAIVVPDDPDPHSSSR